MMTAKKENIFLKREILCICLATLLIASAAAMTIATATTTAYAQTPIPTQRTTPAPEVNAIIAEAQAFCFQKGVRPTCMTVDYQSANLVALHGESLLLSEATFYPNFYLWEVIDKLQTTLGYKINSMAASGLGTKENPTVLHVVLSK